MPEIPFVNIPEIRNSVCILDVDGTLVADNTETVNPEVKERVRTLAAHNDVWLATNSRNTRRNEAIARQLQLPLLTSSFRKPSTRLFDELPEHCVGKPYVVIGDRVLTDGLLAKRGRAQFIKTQRVTGKDRLFMRCIFWFDDVIYTLTKPLWDTST